MMMAPVCEIERCVECGHQWIALFPHGKMADKVECPRCAVVAGVPA
jgi:hypothetical protein